MTLLDAKHVHIVGIGGIGVSAIARWLRARNIPVSGSDLRESTVTKGLKPILESLSIGEHTAGNIPTNTDFLVHSPAVQKDNPERVTARKRGIPELSYPEALAKLSENHFTIAVAGTHGKTTTTAMLGAIFIEAGLDPIVVVGSLIPEWTGNFRYGKGDVCLIEADEYNRSFLAYSPNLAIITNIDRDHLDTYKDIEDIIGTFQQFIERVKESGVVIINHDDRNAVSLTVPKKRKRVEYSISETMSCQPLEPGPGMEFETTSLGKVRLSAPGVHMVSNALAAIATAVEYGISATDIKNGLQAYQGAWRRFEVLGECNGAVVISDYAHHPTEVRATINAAQGAYPKSNIIVVFQPHQKRRVSILKQEFIDALATADTVGLAEIYEVPGREDILSKNISSQEFVRQLQNKNVDTVFLPVKSDIIGYLESKSKPGNVLLCLGAGDIHATVVEFMSNQTNV